MRARGRDNKLQWDAEARTRIAFLVLDAPPHHEDKILKSVQASTLYTECEYLPRIGRA